MASCTASTPAPVAVEGLLYSLYYGLWGPWQRLPASEPSRDGYREIARCDVLRGASRPRTFWTPPVLCNARIYRRNFAGDLVCIDASRQRAP